MIRSYRFLITRKASARQRERAQRENWPRFCLLIMRLIRRRRSRRRVLGSQSSSIKHQRPLLLEMNQSLVGIARKKKKVHFTRGGETERESTFTETELQQLIAEQSYSLAATVFFVNHQTLACCSGKICKVLIVYFSFTYF